MRFLFGFLFFQYIGCFIVCAQNQELERILNAWSQSGNSFIGYKIFATETNIMYDQKSRILDYLKSAKPDADQTAKMLELASHFTDLETNVNSYTYSFEDSNIFISRKQFNLAGQLSLEDETLVLSNIVCIYHHPNVAEGIGQSNLVGSAELLKRETNTLFGLPIFLSKYSLFDFVVGSKTCIYDTGSSLSGLNCDIITVERQPNSPIKQFRIYVQQDTLAPIEFDTYLAGNQMYSHGELRFESFDHKPCFCSEATVKVYNGDKLTMQSNWRFDRISKNTGRGVENFAALLPRRTQIMDQRFTKILNYHMGLRLPNENEIEAMLSNNVGTAYYEAASSSPLHRNGEIPRTERNWIRVAVIIIMVLPVLIILVKTLNRKLHRT